MDDTPLLRSELTALVNRIPPSLNSASTQTVRRYIELVALAKKMLSANKANASTLTGMIRELRQF